MSISLMGYYTMVFIVGETSGFELLCICCMSIWLVWNGHIMSCLIGHLHFKHAQPKICHSPKVENGVDNLFFSSKIHIFGHFLCEEL